MKRIPIILAALTAIFLIACFLEYGFRGLNPDVESDWVQSPAWWQSDPLADIGMFIRWYSVIAASPFERLLGGSLQAFFILCLLVQLFFILVASVLVFYASRLLLHLPGLTTRSSEQAGR